MNKRQTMKQVNSFIFRSGRSPFFFAKPKSLDNIMHNKSTADVQLNGFENTYLKAKNYYNFSQNHSFKQFRDY